MILSYALATAPTDKFPEMGYIGRIPVRNIWLLMLYASDLFRDIHKSQDVTVEENPDDIPDLIAEILVRYVEHRIRRNLTLAYEDRSSVLRRVRGRIDILNTLRHDLIKKGKVTCRFEELTVNTARSRFVRAALDMLARIVQRKELASQCRTLSLIFGSMGVSGEKPSVTEISVDQFGRHDAQDRKMVAAAHLAFDLVIPTEQSGKNHLFEPARNIYWFRKLYEKSMAGFYDVVLPKPKWHVEAGKVMGWQIERQTSGIDEILPSMRTDIILENRIEQRRIVIDTKFNSILTKGWYRPKTLRSGYLYQIYAYLRSQEASENPLNDTASGLLLHPSVNNMINESVMIQGHEIRFATIDLSADAKEIRSQLLEVIGIE